MKSETAPVAIGLGANLGDPAASIRRALELIGEHNLGKVIKTSSLYRTEPVGMKDQPWFINAAALVETPLGPQAFHAGLKAIEAEMGRPEKHIKDGPRVIDLDVILMGNSVIDSAELTLPHPRMHERRFVLEPLREIAAGMVHPAMGLTVEELFLLLRDQARVEKME